MDNDKQSDYSELIGFLDNKFTAVDRRFDAVDENFRANDEEHKELKRMFIDLQSSVDAYAKRSDTYFQEMLMLANKVDRLEKWLRQLADKVGLRLEE